MLRLGSLLTVLSFVACSSTMDVKSHKYATYRTKRTYESTFPEVWKGIEETMRKHKVTERDPEEVNEVELKQLKRRQLVTDWVYGRSKKHFVTFKVNGFPRKKYLQTRYRYQIEAAKVLGGVEVMVGTREELEHLKEDGTPDGYEEIEEDQADTGRANKLLNKIKTTILSQS